MSELINRWFSRTPRATGMAACGLLYPGGVGFSRSWDPRWSEEQLNDLWRRLVLMSEVAGGAAAPGKKWTFEGGTVLSAARGDGSALFVLLPASLSAERDDAGIERLLAEFRALRG